MCDYAKERYAASLTLFKDLEDKAASIITYLGSGAGLLALGTVAAVADAKTDWRIVAWSVPALVCAVVALILALVSRWTVAVCLPPPIKGAVDLANHAVTEARGEILWAAQLNLCVTEMKPTLEKKAWWVEWSMRAAVVAVALTLLPVTAAICIRSEKPKDPGPIPLAAP